MGEIINIAASRAKKTGDSRDWSPLDALKYAAGEIEAGRWAPNRLLIASLNDDSGPKPYTYFCAGGTRLEMVGLASTVIPFLAFPDDGQEDA